jgi:hypothetical protein
MTALLSGTVVCETVARGRDTHGLHAKVHVHYGASPGGADLDAPPQNLRETAGIVPISTMSNC